MIRHKTSLWWKLKINTWFFQQHSRQIAAGFEQTQMRVEVRRELKISWFNYVEHLTTLSLSRIQIVIEKALEKRQL